MTKMIRKYLLYGLLPQPFLIFTTRLPTVERRWSSSMVWPG